MSETKRCSVCGLEKPVSEFYISNGIYYSHCKECHQKYNQEWQKLHREEGRVRTKKYRKKHPDKLRAKHRRESIASIKNLSNKYIRQLIKQQTGYPWGLVKLIQPDLIEEYRQNIINKRFNNKLKNALK